MEKDVRKWKTSSLSNILFVFVVLFSFVATIKPPFTSVTQ
jgi:hypothetical protein